MPPTRRALPARAGGNTAVVEVDNPGSLARCFYKLSQALDDYRLNHWNELSPVQRGQLKDEAEALDSRAHYLTAEALGEISDAIEPELDAIVKATDDAQSALKHLNRVDGVISIAIAAVAVGAAVATGSITTIGPAVTTLVNRIGASG